MKQITKEEFDKIKPNENRITYYPANTDYSQIKKFGEGSSFGELSTFGELSNLGELSSFGEMSRFGKGCTCEEGIDIFWLANNNIPINGEVVVYELDGKYGTFPYLILL